LTKNLRKELGEVDAELGEVVTAVDALRIRRECEKRVKECEERLQQLQSEKHRQAMLLNKANNDLNDARGDAITMFNEQKRYELNIQRLLSDVHRANSAVEMMRTEAVGLRMKNQELRNEKTDRQ